MFGVELALCRYEDDIVAHVVSQSDDLEALIIGQLQLRPDILPGEHSAFGRQPLHGVLAEVVEVVPQHTTGRLLSSTKSSNVIALEGRIRATTALATMSLAFVSTTGTADPAEMAVGPLTTHSCPSKSTQTMSSGMAGTLGTVVAVVVVVTTAVVEVVAGTIIRAAVEDVASSTAESPLPVQPPAKSTATSVTESVRRNTTHLHQPLPSKTERPRMSRTRQV